MLCYYLEQLLRDGFREVCQGRFLVKEEDDKQEAYKRIENRGQNSFPKKCYIYYPDHLLLKGSM